MKTLNGWIATTPFPDTTVKSMTVSGLALIDQTRKLTKLDVLFEAFDSNGKQIFLPGNKVYVKGETMKHQWAGEVLESEDGKKFILIPFSIVVAAVEK